MLGRVEVVRGDENDVAAQRPVRWPVHPLPMPDELLSSWVNRVAIGNGLSPFALHDMLAKQAYPRHEEKPRVSTGLWYRMPSIDSIDAWSWIDFVCTEGVIQHLSTMGDVPAQTIVDMMLAPPVMDAERFSLTYQQVKDRLLASSPYSPSQKWPGLEPVGQINFCSECFTEDEAPYIRKSWQELGTILCDRHHLPLLAGCFMCGHAVQPHRSRDRRPQVSCANCGSDLRRQRILIEGEGRKREERKLRELEEQRSIRLEAEARQYSKRCLPNVLTRPAHRLQHPQCNVDSLPDECFETTIDDLLHAYADVIRRQGRR